MAATDETTMIASAGKRLQILLDSYARLAGAPLASDAVSLWGLPAAVLAHDISDPPEFFFGNAQALALFRMDVLSFIGLPSYKSAEPDLRVERAAMFAQLQKRDIVTGYSGIRIAADGTRFRIVDAMIWNLRDTAGALHGQAARIDRVEPA